MFGWRMERYLLYEANTVYHLGVYLWCCSVSSYWLKVNNIYRWDTKTSGCFDTKISYCSQSSIYKLLHRPRIINMMRGFICNVITFLITHPPFAEAPVAWAFVSDLPRGEERHTPSASIQPKLVSVVSACGLNKIKYR